ncbi:uncharacterized protein LOC120340935 [Styela clava]
MQMRMALFSYAFASVVFLVLLSSQVDKTHAGVSNGVMQRCGNNAREFLRWFCMDSSFDFPFPFNRVYIIMRYRPPVKGLYPFQHQASVCCRFGCPESGYQKMCHYHKKIQNCERYWNHRIRAGRRKRRYSHCRL